ncbi:MAG: MFS transporter [Thermomicrobiales bacterium]
MRRLPIATLLATNLISGLGNAMTSLAVPWFVLETTGSASRTGLTAAVALVPMVVMSFFGGALVDRTSRRGLSIFADVMSAVFLAAIPLLHLMDLLSFPTLLALMFLGAIFDSPGATARQAMVPDLAAQGDVSLERVNSLFGVNQAVSMLAGAPIAGLMIAWLGAVDVLWFATGTFVVSILGMALLVPALPRAEPSGEDFLEDVKIGVRYVWNNSLLRTAILASLVMNMVISPIVGVAVPVLAKDRFGDASSLGLMMSGFGAGILVGSLAFGWLGGRIGARRLVLDLRRRHGCRPGGGSTDLITARDLGAVPRHGTLCRCHEPALHDRHAGSHAIRDAGTGVRDAERRVDDGNSARDAPRRRGDLDIRARNHVRDRWRHDPGRVRSLLVQRATA